MIHVYVVQHTTFREGSRLLAVYASESDANAHALAEQLAEQLADPFYNPDYYSYDVVCVLVQ